MPQRTISSFERVGSNNASDEWSTLGSRESDRERPFEHAGPQAQNPSEDTVNSAPKPEPRATVRRLMSTEKIKMMSPTTSWNMHRRNPWFLSWQQESWAMLFSVACLVAVGAIMGWIDGKRLSIWHWAIEPNAVISVLVVGSKAALMVSTASCISQLKWTHFQRRPRQLRDLEDFDDASRGAWGSFRLLLRRPGYMNIAVTLGCVITVLVLAMETFGQQLLSFPEKRIALTNVTASFPVIQNLSPVPVYGDQLNDRLLQSRLGLMQSIYGQTTDPPFDCPASSCSWNSQVTLGLCSSCQDISSTEGYCSIHVTNENDGQGADYNTTTLVCEYPTFKGRHNVSTTRVSNTGNQGLDDAPSADNASAWTYETRIDINTWSGDDFEYEGQPALAFNFSTIVTNDTWDHPQINLCSLWYCAWVYEESSAQGQEFKADKLDKYILKYQSVQRSQMGLNSGYTGATNYTFSGAGTGFPSDKHNDTFFVYGDAKSQMDDDLMTILASATLDHDSSTLDTGNAGLGSALITNPNITELSQRISESITNVWRNYESTQAIGQAWESVPFIHVEWAWLALPITAVVGAGILLLLTLIQNRRTVLWKSSVLAYSFRPLHGWEDAEFDVETINEIRNRASGMRGQLKEDLYERVRLVRS